MFEFDIGRFVKANHSLGVFGQMLTTMFQQWGQHKPIFNERDWSGWKDDAQTLAVIASGAELPIIARYAGNVTTEMDRHHPNAQSMYDITDFPAFMRLRGALGELVSATRMETETKFFLSLKGFGANLWAAKEPLFGPRVEAAFPAASYDIEEAGKCVATERSTAAVFHLMRAMEAGVAVLGTKLGATVTDSNGEVLPWGIIVANIKPKIDALPAGADRDEWLKVHALLHSVNRAFRTKTAHPVAKYTQEEAENAFAATKAFLQEMAERIS